MPKQQIPEKQGENTDKWANLRPTQFKPGQSGNPNGRPKGSVSLKVWARNMLQTMTDEERLEFLGGLEKIDLWKMAEGNPKQDTDITTAGESLKPILVKFLDNGGNSSPDTSGVQKPV